jgi:hypothetical protein
VAAIIRGAIDGRDKALPWSLEETGDTCTPNVERDVLDSAECKTFVDSGYTELFVVTKHELRTDVRVGASFIC